MRQQKRCLLFRTMRSNILKTKLSEFLIYAKEEQLLCNFPLGGFIFSSFSTSKHSPGKPLILLSREDHPTVCRAQGPDYQNIHSQAVLEAQSLLFGEVPSLMERGTFFFSLLIPSFLSPFLLVLFLLSFSFFFSGKKLHYKWGREEKTEQMRGHRTKTSWERVLAHVMY